MKHLLKKQQLTGEIDWYDLKQQAAVKVDLWNLYDGMLIDRMIIYNQYIIIAKNHTGNTCGYWYVFNLSNKNLEEEFLRQKNTVKLNENWTRYPFQPLSKNKDILE